MHPGRTLPPTAAPLSFRDLLRGLRGTFRGEAEVAARQREFARYFGMRHCFLVSSGRAALTLILTALHRLHPERDQVLIPAYCCYAVPAAVVRAGLRPVLCDIDPATLDYDYDLLPEKLANPRLLGVLVSHLFGLPADVTRLRGLVGDQPVTVIEDAAQALGAERCGHRLGAEAEVSFFSLGRGKPLTAVEGGILLTRNEALAGQLAELVAALPPARVATRLRLVGTALALSVLLHPWLYWLPASLPFLQLGSTRYEPDFSIGRLTSFQAGLLRRWQRKLARLRRLRQDNSRFWARALPQAALMFERGGERLPDLLRFPLRFEGEASSRRLAAAGRRQGLALTYPDAVSAIGPLRELFAGEDYPAARQAARGIVTLPVHGYVSPRDRDRILALLEDFCRVCGRTEGAVAAVLGREARTGGWG